MSPDTPLARILDLARWAPSGDNTQPWRFEITGASRVVVHGFDTREHCVYDLDGHPSQMSIGALLETMSIAASRESWRMLARRRTDLPETTPTFDVEFVPDAGVVPDPLADCILRRSVQRRAMSMRRLTPAAKQALEAAVAGSCNVVWMEGWSKRLELARLLFANAKLRLTMPEAYQVHKAIIEWNATYSEDRVPDQALGADPVTTRLMRFVMHDWGRVRFFNRFLAGTWIPRITMDFLPGIACGAHYALCLHRAPATVDDYVAAGRAVQRFWLAATRLGLVMQPEMTPLIFRNYVRSGTDFTRVEAIRDGARRLQGRLDRVLGADGRDAFWMGRIGHGRPAAARSTRLPLERLLVQSKPVTTADSAQAASSIQPG